MALFRITVKSTYSNNGVKVEKGMSVEVVSKYSNPLSTNGGKEVQEAFIRKYGFDIKKAGNFSSGYLDVQKIN